MKKRGMIFTAVEGIEAGFWDSALDEWTLAPGWVFGEATQKTNFIDKPHGDGSWDMSTALTDGIETYYDRTLAATFECSEGDRASREAKIRDLINQLDGKRANIQLPDTPVHHITGRIHIARLYSDLAHAAIKVTAVCDPWMYSNAETTLSLTATAEKQTAWLRNNGRRAVVPTLTVSGDKASVLLVYGAASSAFSAGTYLWPDLLLKTGTHELIYSGAGSVEITYREAVLE